MDQRIIRLTYNPHDPIANIQKINDIFSCEFNKGPRTLNDLKVLLVTKYGNTSELDAEDKHYGWKTADDFLSHVFTIYEETKGIYFMDIIAPRLEDENE